MLSYFETPVYILSTRHLHKRKNVRRAATPRATCPDRGRDCNRGRGRGRGRYLNRNRRTKDGIWTRETGCVPYINRVCRLGLSIVCVKTGWHRHWCRWPKARRFSTKSEVSHNGQGSQLSLAQMALLGEASCCCATLATSCQCHPPLTEIDGLFRDCTRFRVGGRRHPGCPASLWGAFARRERGP